MTSPARRTPNVTASLGMHDTVDEREAPAPAAATLHVAVRSDTGLVRSSNEDSWMLANGFADPLAADPHVELSVADRPVFAVCDGMGGAVGGEIASSVTAETIQQRIVTADYAGHSRFDDVLAWLEESIVEANWRVRNRAVLNPELKGMGSTCTAAFAVNHPEEGPLLGFGHVGDSRIYCARADRITQLSEDQTLVQRMVKEGQLTPEEAETHDDRHILLQAIGTRDQITIQKAYFPLEVGDRILLSTDGLHDLVDRATLVNHLQGAGTASECADGLLQAALDAGGVDNVTLIVAFVS